MWILIHLALVNLETCVQKCVCTLENCIIGPEQKFLINISSMYSGECSKAMKIVKTM